MAMELRKTRLLLPSPREGKKEERRCFCLPMKIKFMFQTASAPSLFLMAYTGDSTLIFFYKNVLFFSEAQRSYLKPILSLKMFLTCSYFF